jgi:gamma-glutamyltranspeptidase
VAILGDYSEVDMKDSSQTSSSPGRDQSAPDLPGEDPKPFKPSRDRQYATGRRAMASTSHPLATKAAVAALRNGGNAVDAFLAASVLRPEA